MSEPSKADLYAQIDMLEIALRLERERNTCAECLNARLRFRQQLDKLECLVRSSGGDAQ